MAMVLSKSRLRVTEAKFYGNSQTAGNITSISQGQGITLTPNPIVATGTVALTSPVVNSLGGTGADTSATGGAGQYVKQAGLGAAFTVGTIPYTDIGPGFVKIDGTTPLTAIWNAGNFRIDSQNSTRVFNIRAFGAVGNGIADDTAAFTAAIAAMGGTPGVLYMPRGTYVLGAFLTHPNGTVWKGEGMGVSTVLRKAGFDAFGGLVNGGSATGCLFEDFTIDGNSATVPLSVGAEIILGNHGIAHRVEVKNFTFMGFSAGSTTPDWTAMRNCKAIGLGAASIDGGGVAINSLYGVWSSTANSTVIIEGCEIRDCGTSAVFGGDVTILTGNVISGNHRQVNPTGGGQVSQSGGVGRGLIIATGNYFGEGGGPNTSGLELNDQSIIDGNWIEGQGAFGIVLQGVSGAGHVVTGNIVKNSPSTGNFRQGITVMAGITDFTINGNDVSDDQGGGPFLLYGIYVVAGASNRYRITNNRLRNAITANLTDDGTGVSKHVSNNGTGVGFDSTRLVRSVNAVLPPAPFDANTLLHLVAADTNTAPLELQAFSATNGPTVNMRRSRGTAAVPSASQNNDVLGAIQAYGYGQNAYASATRCADYMLAAEAWTNAAQGTRRVFQTTQKTTTTTAEKFAIEDDGGLTNTRRGALLSIPGLLFSQTANSTTTANVLTTLLGTGIGTLTLPANFLTVGKTIRIKLGGYISATDGGAGTKTLTLSLGGVTVATVASGGAFQAAINRAWEASATITCRTVGGGGTVIGGASWETDNGVAAVYKVVAAGNATAACNTTGTLAIDLKLNNGDATGTATTTWATVETLT